MSVKNRRNHLKFTRNGNWGFFFMNESCANSTIILENHHTNLNIDVRLTFDDNPEKKSFYDSRQFSFASPPKKII